MVFSCLVPSYLPVAFALSGAIGVIQPFQYDIPSELPAQPYHRLLAAPFPQKLLMSSLLLPCQFLIVSEKIKLNGARRPAESLILRQKPVYRECEPAYQQHRIDNAVEKLGNTSDYEPRRRCVPVEI